MAVTLKKSNKARTADNEALNMGRECYTAEASMTSEGRLQLQLAEWHLASPDAAGVPCLCVLSGPRVAYGSSVPPRRCRADGCPDASTALTLGRL